MGSGFRRQVRLIIGAVRRDGIGYWDDGDGHLRLYGAQHGVEGQDVSPEGVSKGSIALLILRHHSIWAQTVEHKAIRRRLR